MYSQVVAGYQTMTSVGTAGRAGALRERVSVGAAEHAGGMSNSRTANRILSPDASRVVPSRSLEARWQFQRLHPWQTIAEAKVKERIE